MNLPLLVRDPLLAKQGTTCEARVAWTDLTPTILDYCRVAPKPRRRSTCGPNGGGPNAERRRNAKEAPVDFHGRSFLTAMADAKPPGWDESICIAHVPRDHDVLPDAGRDRRQIETDLQHRPPVAVPVRQRPLRLADMAGRSQTGRQKLRHADSGVVCPSATVRALQPEPGSVGNEKPGDERRTSGDARTTAEEDAGVAGEDRGSLGAEMAI